MIPAALNESPIMITGGLSSLYVACANRTASNYIFRVFRDGAVLDTIATNSFSVILHAVKVGTYQVGVSIDGAPEILSDTIVMEIFEKPHTDLRY